jgi:hypothetical protein
MIATNVHRKPTETRQAHIRRIVLEATAILSEPFSLRLFLLSKCLRLLQKVEVVAEISASVRRTFFASCSCRLSLSNNLSSFSSWCRFSSRGFPACRIVDDQVSNGTITKHDALRMAARGITSSSPNALPLQTMRHAWIAAAAE